MHTYIDPPHLEIQFYLSCGNPIDNLFNVMEVIRKLGGIVHDKIEHIDVEIGKESEFRMSESATATKLLKTVANNQYSKIVCEVIDATGLFDGEIEILQNLLKYDHYSPASNGMIMLITKGEMFSFWPELYTKESVFEAGEKLVERFLLLIEGVNPDYAAITNEYTLETPNQLRLDTNSGGFLDFYLSADKFPMAFLTELANDFKDQGGFVHRMSKGVYYSSFEFFNPARKSFLNFETAEIISKKVGAMIGQMQW